MFVNETLALNHPIINEMLIANEVKTRVERGNGRFLIPLDFFFGPRSAGTRCSFPCGVPPADDNVRVYS